MTGARERHIERCRYNPSEPKKAFRKAREDGKTYKRKGDLVIVNSAVKPFIAPSDGWY